jgi:hypothetical protein
MNAASSLGQVFRAAALTFLNQPAVVADAHARLEANVGSIFPKRKSPLHKIVCGGGSASESAKADAPATWCGSGAGRPAAI